MRFTIEMDARQGFVCEWLGGIRTSEAHGPPGRLQRGVCCEGGARHEQRVDFEALRSRIYALRGGNQ